MIRVVALALAVPSILAAQLYDTVEVAADRVFAQWTTRTPGCAVGVARNGRTVLTRGYGMANLETGTPITPETIFESGSVAKQFTATAVLLLMKDGRLRLDDRVQQYVPELPDYGRPITIRHLLSHTSGLREWSNLVALQGWPRGTRAHTQDELLEVVFAQKALNYPTGDYYSYTNSGYALLQTIVERVSGMSFATFSDKRIFQPLGMMDTRWRDDFTVVVPRRAQAYGSVRGEWRLNMPFEDVVGPGGLLTTVGDWLKWNAALDQKTIGADIVDSLTSQATLTSGRRISYAMGLMVGRYRGLPEIAHSGSTAGYSTYLTRFPTKNLSIAVLCNVAGAPATRFARELVDAAVPGLPSNAVPDTVSLDATTASRFTGIYRSTRFHDPLLIGSVPGLVVGPRGGRAGMAAAEGATVRGLRGGGYLVGMTPAVFDEGHARPGGVRLVVGEGDTVSYVLAATSGWTPNPRELAEFAGRYRSDELDVTYVASVDSGQLVLTLRRGTRRELAPAYPDAFIAQGMGTVWFTRDGSGRVNAMHSGTARVWDISFERVK